ncbi:ExeM/NucH family extracellular endonuclease [Nocardioides sp. SOB77]|uniref:ExeM/NucH family extracellular endonuclease n=1 Tax=Nocardioides oceani TaxID=3058369 RepID=A0ABT8FHW7_9ACTN|nr:ExeM/NucH family extracellular endonuclease [Nocardioides oceani]MDN4174146.1 ExeM/NucH family extracellular endonuclease [Nocardioides oceani]
MPSSGRSPRRLLASLSGLAVAATGLSLAPLPAHAVSPNLVISEVYGGGGNAGATYTHDFIEIHNPTSSDVSVDGWSVQYRSSGGTSPGAVTTLSGTVPAGGNYLVQQAKGSGGTQPLPPPDATGDIAMSGSAFTVWLSNGTTALNPTPGSVTAVPGIVDLVGVNSNTFETTKAAGTANATSASRTAPDADNNAAEFTVGAPSPENSGTAAPVALEGTAPGPQTATVGVYTDRPQLKATGGEAPYTWTASGLPAGLTIAPDGTVSGTPTTPGTSSVTATVTDGTGATDTVDFTYTVQPAPAPTTIAEIQGPGGASPVAGGVARTRGVVTAVYPTGGLNGFYLQTGGTGGTAPDTTAGSDGIFVYGGPSGFATYPEVGDSVEVTGRVAEFQQTVSGQTSSLTQLTNASFVELEAALAPVAPRTTAWYTSDAEREAHEGELLVLTDELTVTNSYATWQYGEIGLATGGRPLVQPTEVEDAQTGDVQGVAADNARRALTLDDGKSLNFGGAASGEPMSWLDADHSVRVGAAATLAGAVVLDHRNGLYKVQPTAPVQGRGTDVAQFEDTRAENATPADVGGDNRLATFNVLNYFPTTGEEFVAGGGSCSYYQDRTGEPVTTDSCNPNGPRGAADVEDFERQEAKIVTAINGLGASIVSLEEIENSVRLGKDRDFAVRTLVAALNERAGAGTWDYVPSPPATELPAPSQEDVIRTAFIYRPAKVEPVGASDVLLDEVNFDNAREPLAQAFKAVGAADSEAFGVIVNHFKSKSSGPDDGTGQGASNQDRIDQAEALDAFADDFAAARGIEAVFLTGDFNAYTEEDPVQVLEESGWTALESTDDADEESYSFQGLYGSLDHVFANAAAQALVTGVDIWQINANESVAYQYGRYNSNVVDLYRPHQFGASDHNPEIVGLDLVDEPTFPGPVDPPTPGPVDPPTPGPTDPPTPGPTDPPTPGPTDPEPTPEPVTPTIKAFWFPQEVVAGRTRVTLTVKVVAEGEAADGWVRVSFPGKKTKVVRLEDGVLKVKLWKFGGAGDKTVTITYNGRGDVGAKTVERVVTVVKR